jgi:hypothetical protein
MYIIINFALICLLDFVFFYDNAMPMADDPGFFCRRVTLIKKKTIFSSYIRKFRWDRDLGKGFLIYEEIPKYLTI